VQAQVSRHGVTQSSDYRYDELGRRISKTDAFGTTHYLQDGHLMIQSQRASQQAWFVYEPNSFVPLATLQQGQIYWLQCHQIGAPLERTDERGRIAWAADYKVWGGARVWEGVRIGTGERAMGWGHAEGRGSMLHPGAAFSLPGPAV